MIHMPTGAHPLAMGATGQRVRLVRITAGSTLVHRLVTLGLTPGVELKVVQNEGGAVVLAVRDTRLAVGRGVAHKILVEGI